MLAVLFWNDSPMAIYWISAPREDHRFPCVRRPDVAFEGAKGLAPSGDAEGRPGRRGEDGENLRKRRRGATKCPAVGKVRTKLPNEFRVVYFGAKRIGRIMPKSLSDIWGISVCKTHQRLFPAGFSFRSHLLLRAVKRRCSGVGSGCSPRRTAKICSEDRRC